MRIPCEAFVGGSCEKLASYTILCSRRARYLCQVDLGNHPDDRYEMFLCGQHHRYWEEALASAIPIDGVSRDILEPLVREKGLMERYKESGIIFPGWPPLAQSDFEAAMKSALSSS